ncbi:MAG: TIR domain-containing protein [Anaerolineales bacterium]
MSASPTPFFFLSYGREDTVKQRRIVRELRERGIKIWVDVENLTPGTPTWEREIEKAIRASTGLIVLLSPESNNSEWVRREISFGEQHRRRIFPVLIEGDDDNSTPLRLMNHQRVDLRTHFEAGLDELAAALKEYINVKQDIATQSMPAVKKTSPTTATLDWKKLILPAVIALVGVFCVTSGVLAARYLANLGKATETPVTSVPIVDPIDATVTPDVPTPVVVKDEPTGKIVYTCSINGDEVCIMNADGSDAHQLTNSNLASFNASLSADGKSIVYVVGKDDVTEIYEMVLATQKVTQLTDFGKALGSPEISPDGTKIIFHYRNGNSPVELWLMDRDGNNPHKFYSKSGNDVHDGTWSPDGTQILFAMGKNDVNKLYIMDLNGGDPKVVNDTVNTRGRSDWSTNDLISFDQGGPFAHDVYLMNINGSSLHQLTELGINAQGASLSPDGKWVAFSGYTNVAGKDQASCEIFIMRVDGSDLQQLTKNKYCDYQPRWGN